MHKGYNCTKIVTDHVEFKFGKVYSESCILTVSLNPVFINWKEDAAGYS